MDKKNICSTEEKKNEDGKGGKRLEKENICSAEEKKNGEGKGGKHWILDLVTVWLPNTLKLILMTLMHYNSKSGKG